MTDDDLIRRGDALKVLQSGLGLTMSGQARRIAALPAVTAPQGMDAPVAWREEDRTHPGWYYYGDAKNQPIPAGAQPLYATPAQPAPYMTDLMVDPESIDAFVAANPLPPDPIGDSQTDDPAVKLTLAEALAVPEVTALVRDLKKMVKAAYCEGFRDGKDGGWIVGPENQPWNASYSRTALRQIGGAE